MEGKRLKDDLFTTSKAALQFTKEDRQKVFEQIHHPNKKKKWLATVVPLTASLCVIALCFVLLLPLIIQEGQQTSDKDVVTTLITLKGEDDRIHINLLLAYSQRAKTLHVLSLPRDMYVPIFGEGGAVTQDKLTFAYTDGAESVRRTVAELFDLAIDYYAVMNLSTFSAWLATAEDMDYSIPEDIRVRAISQAAFEFDRGIHQLNGEEVVALMMAATEGQQLGREHLLKLLNVILYKMQHTQWQAFTKRLETNAPLDAFLETEIKAIKPFSIIDGQKSVMQDGKYFAVFEPEFLKHIAQQFMTFDDRLVSTVDTSFGWETSLFSDKLDAWKSGDEPFVDNLVEEVMQQMAHQKVIAESKEGSIMMTVKRIDTLLQMVEQNKAHYVHHEAYLNILTRWQQGDFSMVDADHNVLMDLQGSKAPEGLATGIASKEQEVHYIFQVFAQEVDEVLGSQ
ncbi:DUF6241 domain-containing protein [Lysinibacillus louembei]|uniref:DUF6241 domain-containing protein n=1 Tax=Lysinibacillus louembei TaxID=1470088 RepID=A0ABZ0RSF2_9BACI|nr:DUF6241 domain-containing protein [Lysinibacillus louembei]WPK11154.1 DUF6241 domain-containing protein [Lysinibacillus louembei]